MPVQIILIGFIIAFSVTSATLYLLPIIIFGAIKTNNNTWRGKLDNFLKNIVGILSIFTAILSIMYALAAYPLK